ncbi:HigA family addiction module antitoxin [Pleomorphomonas sp. JP5]|uniref:HigA family addiction module antitoxin n=1 Tax=Pleomorphomonas sp. JP5 TaxID=2942998 RepID=UPI00204323FB|nr:HigA family addiction module antitoxin [Pleomorphomonas sp. JP5]MCM5557263.1 HigA family addiction module antitoxin [Pleomorphomonas sp. JP5]
MPRDMSLHPGIALRDEFLKPMGLSIPALAEAIGVSSSLMAKICNGRQAMSASIALRLGRYLAFDPQWFMTMQSKYDLSAAAEDMAEALDRIRPCEAA